MTELPAHADVADEPGPEAERARTATRWRTGAFVLIAIVLAGGFVALHLTGVIGPGVH